MDVAADKCNSDNGSLFGDDNGMNNNAPLAEDPAAEELFQTLPADPAIVEDADYAHDIGGQSTLQTPRPQGEKTQ